MGAAHAVFRYHEEPLTSQLVLAAAASGWRCSSSRGSASGGSSLPFACLEVRRVGLEGALGGVRAYAFWALFVLPMGPWYAVRRLMGGLLVGAGVH